MKSHRRHPVFAPRLNRYLTTCLAVGVVAACSTSNQSPVTPTATTGQTVSDVYQVASYWQPTPQLDLLSPAGTFVRGAMESNSAIITTQSKAVAYPGFPEPDNLSYPSRFSADQQIRTSFNGGRIFTVLDVQEETPSLLIVRVCRVSRISVPDLPPQNTDITITTLRIREGHKPPSARQSGSRKRPTDNIFGDWTIDSLVTDDFPAAIPPACNASGLPAKSGQPSTPGWPSAGPSSASPTS